MMMITVKAQKKGCHCYPDAPEEVAFLRDMHRHVFHVEAEIQVFRDDRELEFFIVQKQLESILDEIFGENILSMSCEFIAVSVRLKLLERFPGVTHRRVNVRVSEDAECGVYLIDK